MRCMAFRADNGAEPAVKVSAPSDIIYGFLDIELMQPSEQGKRVDPAV